MRDYVSVHPVSVALDQQTLETTFLLTDGVVDFQVHYTGILPDLFSEGEAVVVNGELRDNGGFYASQVLAKHDETYMPPEVAETMAAIGDGHSDTCEVVQRSEERRVGKEGRWGGGGARIRER